MPIAIGRSVEADYSDPLGLLGNCHLRIKKFLRVMIDVTKQARGQALSEEQRTALGAALSYFREAAPKHTLDEEESLFPRMRATTNPEVKAALDGLDVLHQDHEIAGAAHAEVGSLAGRWLADGTLSNEAAARLSELLERLDALYQKHIAIEDDQIFPLAGRVLNPSELLMVGREMAKRRGVDFEAIRSAFEQSIAQG